MPGGHEKPNLQQFSDSSDAIDSADAGEAPGVGLRANRVGQDGGLPRALDPPPQSKAAGVEADEEVDRRGHRRADKRVGTSRIFLFGQVWECF